MRECMFCGSKSISFYVSSEDKYICAKHYQTAKEYLGEDSVKHFYKNKIVVEGNKAYMTIYNNKFTQKETVVFDAEDIELVKNVRWHISSRGHVVTCINPSSVRVSKTTGLVLKDTIRLCDYILFKREGIAIPTYHTNGDTFDCRKSNMRKCRDKLRQKSSVQYMKNVVI